MGEQYATARPTNGDKGERATASRATLESTPLTPRKERVFIKGGPTLQMRLQSSQRHAPARTEAREKKKEQRERVGLVLCVTKRTCLLARLWDACPNTKT